jgi:hypothetical protein
MKASLRAMTGLFSFSTEERIRGYSSICKLTFGITSGRSKALRFGVLFQLKKEEKRRRRRKRKQGD